jgi:hypothetical protein
MNKPVFYLYCWDIRVNQIYGAKISINITKKNGDNYLFAG